VIAYFATVVGLPALALGGALFAALLRLCPRQSRSAPSIQSGAGAA